MSEENEAAIHRLFEAFNYADERSIAAVDEFDPDIAIRDHPRFPDAQWHHGPFGVEKWAAKIWTAFGKVQFEVIEFVHVSEDRFIVHARVHLMGKRSGITLPAFEGFDDITMRDGKVLRVDVFETMEEALEAAGLRE